MNRDGNTHSIWQDSLNDFQSHTGWNKDTLYDVLIVGGGITGLTTALLLQSEGRKCILAEAYNIGFGTTGGTTAHLNTILDTTYDVIESDFGKENAKLVARSTREAIDLVEGLVTKHNIDCDFEYKTAYLFAQDDTEAEELSKIMDATTRAGVVNSCDTEIPVPIPFQKACRIELQAQIHPGKYIVGLAKAFEEAGGIILQKCIVSNVESGEHYTADTSLGQIKAAKVVYATHIPPGINLLHFRCAPWRSYAVAFTLNSGEYPDALVYDMKDPYHYFRTQEINGQRYIIAGGYDHKTGDKINTEQKFRELEAYLRNHFDIKGIDYQWSSQYYMSADGLPYIGVLPGATNIYTATGFQGNGITLGSLSGKILCELITNGNSVYKDLYAPSRVKPVAGFAEFMEHNMHVVSKFVGMRFGYEDLESMSELAHGEAMLADWQGEKVAVYKDENGKVHILDPVCPHAKCIVEWNSAEKSWDCPCHGSRFACNGALLTGPARTGLTQIKVEHIHGD
jgi:glycine/D-amino acid oxidase-like deaminating enzyme/nitrite reductase/ring-hydroxylating ferredoxin subunit